MTESDKPPPPPADDQPTVDSPAPVDPEVSPFETHELDRLVEAPDYGLVPDLDESAED